MARSFIHYNDNGSPRWGELEGAAPKRPTDAVRLRPLAAAPASTAQLLTALDRGENLGNAADAVEVKGAALLSPVTSDAAIVCQGLNYMSHSAGDADIHARKDNLIFFKASSTLCGPYDDVVKPTDVEMLDYEVEVGLVMRRALRAGDVVTPQNIGKYVSGAVLCNDISARDVMFGATYMQWSQGKSYRTFLPAGPVFYWLEEGEVAEVLEHLRITLGWRDQQRQQGVTSQMIFKPAETLSFLATFMDLKPGDLLLTGTPGGVIAKGTPKINAILKEYLLDDGQRRPLFVAEAHAAVSDFIQAGDVLVTEMVDERANLDLGGQYSRVV